MIIDGLRRRHFVQIVAVGMAAKRDVVVSIAADPFAWRSDGSLALQRRHQLVDRLHPVGAQPYSVIRRVFIEDRLRVKMRIIESGVTVMP